MAALIKAVNEARAKVSLPPITSKLPEWKRWVGGESPDHDGTGLRDVVLADARYLDEVKGDLDSFRENNGVAHVSFDQRLKLLEAQQTTDPFPGSG
jgi:hypothetical protein